MATSPDYVRLASSASRPLTEAIFDALREAVVVIDARFKHLPLVLANATARRCLLGNVDARPLNDCSIYSLLGAEADSAVEALGCALDVIPRDRLRCRARHLDRPSNAATGRRAPSDACSACGGRRPGFI